MLSNVNCVFSCMFKVSGILLESKTGAPFLTVDYTVRPYSGILGTRGGHLQTPFLYIDSHVSIIKKENIIKI